MMIGGGGSGADGGAGGAGGAGGGGQFVAMSARANSSASACDTEDVCKLVQPIASHRRGNTRL